MKGIVSLIGVIVLVSGPVNLAGSETILERYLLKADAGIGSLDFRLSDRSFGGGTAKSVLAWKSTTDGARLTMTVSRSVKPGEVVFALLVFHVEVRGYDETGQLTYSESIGGFTFGDSEGGRWEKNLSAAPVDLTRIVVAFYGNYE